MIPECQPLFFKVDLCTRTTNKLEVVHDNPIFFEKFVLPQKLGNRPKTGFLSLKFGH